MAKTQASQGAYKKGKDRRNHILDVARDLLIDSGYHNFSLRKVAEKAGIRVGNLQYYFPAKSDLVKAMLDHVIDDYLADFDDIRGHGTPEEQFVAVIEDVITDLNGKKTTVFFPELWSLSNHEKGITRSMDNMYQRYREVLAEIILEINPGLSQEQSQRLALFFSASIEGHTIFIGYRKPWRKETANIVDMASQSFLWLIKDGRVPG
ncbi:MAG: TetR family transcriptional regulator [Haliea sp.]|nr:TetR family transcriptional regulator [Haliea sp.]